MKNENTMNTFSEAANLSRIYAISLISFILVLCISGYFFISHNLNYYRELAEKQLESVGRLKARELSYWIHEKIRDSETISQNQTFRENLATFLENPDDPQQKASLKRWIKLLCDIEEYSEINLYDAHFEHLLGYPDKKNPNIEKPPLAFFNESINNPKSSFAGIFRNTYDQSANMYFFVPIDTVDNKGGQIRVLMVVTINPHTFIFPYVQTWPTVSDTAETLLFKRDGEDVLFINELRHRKNTSLNLWIDIKSNPQLPAAMGALGKRGLVEGLDYRGEPVLAVILKVEGTPWLMVSKLDASEAYHNVWVYLWMAVGLMLSVVIIVALSGLMIWNLKRQKWLIGKLNVEQENRELANRILSLNKYANDIIILADSEKNIIEVNNRACKRYGFSENEFTKMTTSTLFADSKSTSMSTTMCSKTTNNRFESVHMAKSGEKFEVEISVSEVESNAKKYQQWIIRDISERIRAEKELRETSEKMNAFFSSNLIGILFGDIYGNIFSTNDEFLRIIGYDRDDLQEHRIDWKNITPEQYLDLDYKYIRMAQEEGSCTPYEKEYTRKDGSRIWVYIGYVLIGEKHDKSVAFILDISGRKAAENEIIYLCDKLKEANSTLEARVEERTQELQIRYEEVEKLNFEILEMSGDLQDKNAKIEHALTQLTAANKELEAFSYSVSHDLRSPLRAISGFSEALLEDYAKQLDETGRDYLNRLINASQRMGVLIDDILKLSRISRAEINLNRIDLSYDIKNIINTLAETEPDRKYELVFNGSLEVLADQSLVRVALDNILRNSWKFSKKREETVITVGEITKVTTDKFCVYNDDSPIPDELVGVINNNKYKTIYIRDNGAGFDMKYADKLFGAFQRLHSNSEFEGTGIGLATVKRVILKHGGHVWADSAPDRGTTIYLTFNNQPDTGDNNERKTDFIN